MPLDPKNSNEQLFDALLRHQIYLLRASGTIRNDVIELLNKVEQSLAAEIRIALAKSTGSVSVRLKQAQDLMKRIKKLRTTQWDLIDKELATSMTTLTKHEVGFLSKTFDAVLPVVYNTALPSAALISSLTKERPFQGRILNEWSKDLVRKDLRRMEDQIKIGIVQGENANTITRRLFGTVRFKGRDGVTQVSRRQLTSLVRTATIHFTNGARNAFLKDNSDIIDSELYVATLDARTTPICRSLDGRVFPLGIGPQPPLHFQCRSLRVAVFNGEVVGSRPAKPVTQKMLLKEFARRNNLVNISNRQSIPHGLRTKFDNFSRFKIREMVGSVPAKTSYQEWLKTQTIQFQDEVLGKTRGILFRKGGLTLDKFVNRQGDEIPLSNLMELESAAFKAAGINFN